MSTCFLFSETLNDDGALCVLFENETLSSPERYSFTKLQSFASLNMQFIIVMSTTHVGIHEIMLPWLPAKKARLALAFSLEDKLIAPLSETHLAFDKSHYHDGKYLIAVLKKELLHSLLDNLSKHAILPDVITCDWFALKSNEGALSPHTLLVSSDNFKGALSQTLAKGHAFAITTYTFEDSHPNFPLENETKKKISFYTWVAERLQQSSPINFFQGTFPKKKEGHTSRWYHMTIASCTFWFLLFIIGMSIKWIYLNHTMNKLDQKIAIIYRQFFPNATTVTNPKFRTHEYLKAYQNSENITFWALLNGLQKTIDLKTIQVQKIRYRKRTLEITLIATHFSDLETLSDAFKKAHLKIRHSEASSVDGKVKSTLDLTL